MGNNIKILLGQICRETVVTWCHAYNKFDLLNINDLILFKSIFHGQSIIYQSSIAVKLAKITGRSPVVIAREIITNINFNHNNFQHIFSNQILSTGLINWQLTDYGVSLCLTEIINVNWCDLTASLLLTERLTERLTETLIEKDYFSLQYPFMRCNSLLKLAEYDHLIRLECKPVENLQPDKRKILQILTIIKPPFIQWLNNSNNLNNLNNVDYVDKLLFRQSSERELIVYHNYIFDLIFYGQDDYHLNFSVEYQQPCRSNINWLKIAQLCGEKFDKFDRQCRIWGEVKDDYRSLAEARLGLVLITHHLFAYMLTRLNIPLIREV